MIKDRIENIGIYANLGVGIAKAADYLARTDFFCVVPGRYELDGDRVFALVQEYEPKALCNANYESHRKYIDVQYVARGTERMGHLSLQAEPKIMTPYDSERDVVFYESLGSGKSGSDGELGVDWLTFRAGDFAIFTPQDVHAPGVAITAGNGNDGNPDRVLKVVVKVRVNETHPCGF